MKIDDLMVREVYTCFPEDSCAVAARLMWDHDCGFIPVLDPEKGTVLGVITDRDICMAAFTQGLPLPQIAVSRVMARNVYVCRSGETLEAAHEIMRRNRVRRLPVVDAELKPIGIITLNDVALYTTGSGAAKDRNAKNDLAETLAAVCKHHLATTA
ncbi:MAG: CBS domain-containing protein [Planctomycetes bacterium]|nr:CBS domain-containing protein [Planctomycetota bacterium]